MTGKVKVGVAIAAPTLALLAIGLLLWLNRPFQEELGFFRTSLIDRTEAQKQNIRQALKSLDGVIIEPGETLSFNNAVGPRTQDRGYQNARAFMEGELITSLGGGICQLSSTVYNAALLAGFRIDERHSHSRIVASVPPGRDATVWYGTADLQVTNTFPYPARISCRISGDTLSVSFIARRRHDIEISLNTIDVSPVHHEKRFVKSVRVTRTPGATPMQELISIDGYYK